MKSIVLAIGIAAALTTSAQAQTKPLNVKVTNVPLPVTGTVADADAGKFTHVGQKPDAIVDLEFADIGSGINNHVDAFRIDLVTFQKTLFVVPAGFFFVLTDVSASVGCAPASGVSLELEHDFDAGHNRTSRDRTFAVCGAAGVASFDRGYETGIFYSAGAIPAMDAGGATGIIWARARGYLVPAN